jgi:Bacterial PH domain
MSDRDFDFEPQPGIPAPLPVGEDILWQGKPQAAALARDAYKINWVLGYMIAIALWRAGAAWADGGASLALATLLPYLVLAAAGYGVVFALAWAQARAAIYTITTARVILRVGAALPVTYTIPFTRIATAALAEKPGGTGTIALELKGSERIAYGILWPHARPWFLRQPQPAFRSIADARQVARLLADAAQAKVNEPVIELRGTQAPGLTLAAE